MTSGSIASLFALSDVEVRDDLLDEFDGLEKGAFSQSWDIWARPQQLAPVGDWRLWLIIAGRGFGKTRAGAEWVRAVAQQDKAARIALVGANFAEARAVMVEGESGLLSIAPDNNRPTWEPSLKKLRWPNGAQAHLFSAADPDGLRGSQHSHAWCDEVAKWSNNAGQALAAWDNLKLGLRLGEFPRIAATTTPRPVAIVRRLINEQGVIITRGKTRDNQANLPPAFISAMQSDYGGTRLGRQELGGELIQDTEDALWTRAMIEGCRVREYPRPLGRIVVGVDPPASETGDACGIIIVGLGPDGAGYVLADCSAEKASPEKWARTVSAAAETWGADRVIAEANQGGDMVRTVLHASNIALPVKLVNASRGKTARAEPVAALYETGRVHHAGAFARLEDEMCGLIIGGRYEGPGRSPDRADALVWALTELMLGQQRRPQIRQMPTG